MIRRSHEEDASRVSLYEVTGSGVDSFNELGEGMVLNALHLCSHLSEHADGHIRVRESESP